MIPTALLALLSPTVLVALAPAADPDPGARAESALRALAAKSPQVVTVSTLAKSGAGHEVLMARVGKRGGGPAVLLVAGVDGRHRVGVEAAVAVAEKVAAEAPAWLDRATLYVVPCLNPDAFAAGNAPPLVDFGRVRGPSDADRDRRVGEDAA